MNIGLAEVNITPPLGTQIPGYGPKQRLSTGVKDELFAKAMVVEEGETVLAFIVLDAISLELSHFQNIRKRIHQFTGIPEENVMLSCTHTHTGLPRYEEGLDAYFSVLESKAADAVIIAYSRREEAKVGFARGHEDSIAFNRRFYMKDGTVKTNPGILNPNIVKPVGPIDPEVVVMRIDNAQGEPIGIVSNYSCHTDTVGGTEYCADYPGYVNRIVKQTFGERVISFFVLGVCGDINHHDVKGGNQPVIIPHHQRMGQILGLEVAKVRNKTKAVPQQRKIAARSRLVEVTTRPLSEEEAESERQVLKSLEGIPDEQLTGGQIMNKGRAERLLQTVGQPLPAREYEIQVSSIGDLAFVALPAEIFVEFGLTIKEKSPFAFTVVTGLSNGSGLGYVCTPQAIQHGSYEPSGHAFEVNAGDKFVAAAIELLQELHESR